MSFLDMYQTDQAVAARTQPNEGRDLPATFSEGFNAAWSDGQLFSQSIAKENARAGVLSDYLDEIKQKTGKDLSQQFVPDTAGGGQTGVTDFTRANDAVTKMKEDYPDLNLDPLNDDEIERRAVAKSRAAQDGYAAFAAREKTAGGVAGGILGGVASAAADPVNLLALAVAPEAEIGILGSALRWGGIAGASQAAIEAIGSGYHEEVQPGYAASGQAAENVLGAAAFGAGLGGLTKALGNLWTRAKTGAWPTSVRDAGNVLESEANVANSNVYLGAEGEAAHWEALNFSIDSILSGKPVDVSNIITPEMEARSRNIIVRLEGERASALPIFDARAIALTSEEAGLRNRDQALASQLETIPEGNATSADRLNRLQAVDQQIASATDPSAKRALSERRDQILVDTTPERLQAEAAPIEQRRVAEAQRASIASRLNEIANERARIQGENLSAAGPAMIGQREPVRAVPIEQIRANATAAREAAQAERAASGDGELPFQASAAEGHAQDIHDALASGVSQVAQRAGYAMPAEEAATIAARLAKATPDEAADLMRDLQVSPRQVAEAPTRVEPDIEPPEPIEMPKLDDKQQQAALRSGLDQARMTNDVQVHMGADADGKPITQSLDSLMNGIDADREAADHIEGCINPAPQEEAA